MGLNTEIITEYEVHFDGTLDCPQENWDNINSEDCVGCAFYRGRETEVDCFVINCAFDCAELNEEDMEE